MSPLEEYRQAHPEYRDVPDQKLAEAIYEKHYADKLMPEDFYGKLGLSSTPKATSSGLVGRGLKHAVDAANQPGTWRDVAEIGLSMAVPESIAVTKGPGAIRWILRALESGAGGAAGSVISETFDPSEDPLASAGAAGLLGLGGQMGGEVATKVVGKAAAPFANKLEPGAKETMDILGKEATLTPGLATTSRFLDILENVADVSLIGGGRIRAKKEAAQAVVGRKLDELVDSFYSKATKEDVGELIQNLVSDRLDAFKIAAKKHYDDVDRLVGKKAVSLADLKADAGRISMELASGLKSGSPGTAGIIDDILGKPDVVTFGEAATLRSDLLAITRGSTDLIPTKAKGAGKRLAASLDRSMQNAARGVSGDALRAWRTANAFWKRGAQEYNSQFMRSLAAKDPEMVYQSAIRPNRPGTIRRVRTMINDNDLWRPVQGQFLKDLMAKSSDEVGRVSGKKFLKGMKDFGDDALKEMFPSGGHVNNMKKLGDALALTQAKPADSAMRLATQFAQVGAIGVVLHIVPGPTGTAVATLLAPRVLAGILTNPAATRWLTIGLTTGAGTSRGMQASARLGAWLAKEKMLNIIKGVNDEQESQGNQ